MSGIADKPVTNAAVPAGQVIIPKGQPVRNLVILQKGQTIVQLPEQAGQGRVLARSLYKINAPAVLGAVSLLGGKSMGYQVSAQSPCEVSVYASNRDYLIKLFGSKPGIALLAIKSISNDCNEIERKLSELELLLAAFDGYETALSLAFADMLPEKFGANTGNAEFSDPILVKATEMRQFYLDNMGQPPHPVNLAFLRGASDSVSTHLSMNDAAREDNLEFIKKFIALPQDILTAIAQRDSTLLFSAGEELAGGFSPLSADFDKSFFKIHEFLRRLVSGDYSWLEKFALQADLTSQNLTKFSKPDFAPMAEFFLETMASARDKAKAFAEIALPASNAESVRKLTIASEVSAPSVSAAQETVHESTASASPGLENFRDSFQKICDWCEFPADKYTPFKKDWETLKGMKNPLDGSDEVVRKLRRKINNLFWEVWEKGMIKWVKTKEALPRYMELFFQYGFMDETALEPAQLKALNAINLGKGDPDVPVYTITEWMAAIGEKKLTTSISELGLTFFEMLRQDTGNRDKKWRKESDLPPDVNSPENRVKFEIKQMLGLNCRLCSGSISQHLNILTRFQITTNFEKLILTKDTLAAQVKELLKLDFSAFHREVLYTDEKIGINREFVQKQVIPNFLLVPSIGSVMQFWQEKEGNDKASRGRLICPTLITTDLSTMLMRAVAIFRWEMTKAVQGPDWNNIGVSSITADYTDYVQFFHKNKELSEEIKEKLDTEFKRFRDDRSKFVNDYMVWMRYESEGTQRMNKVIRKIMAKHIPFSKPFRDKLLTLPSYQDIIEKSINIRRRKAAELAPRYQKYMRNNNNLLPDELRHTQQFYNMEF